MVPQFRYPSLEAILFVYLVFCFLGQNEKKAVHWSHEEEEKNVSGATAIRMNFFILPNVMKKKTYVKNFFSRNRNVVPNENPFVGAILLLSFLNVCLVCEKCVNKRTTWTHLNSWISGLEWTRFSNNFFKCSQQCEQLWLGVGDRWFDHGVLQL